MTESFALESSLTKPDPPRVVTQAASIRAGNGRRNLNP
jgi:hypothetical protein